MRRTSRVASPRWTTNAQTSSSSCQRRYPSRSCASSISRTSCTNVTSTSVRRRGQSRRDTGQQSRTLATHDDAGTGTRPCERCMTTVTANRRGSLETGENGRRHRSTSPTASWRVRVLPSGTILRTIPCRWRRPISLRPTSRTIPTPSTTRAAASLTATPFAPFHQSPTFTETK